MPISSSALRLKRCVCYNKYQKRTRKDLTCNCSAKFIKERYLRDPSTVIWRVTPSRLRVARAECDESLLESSLRGGRTRRSASFLRVRRSSDLQSKPRTAPAKLTVHVSRPFSISPAKVVKALLLESSEEEIYIRRHTPVTMSAKKDKQVSIPPEKATDEMLAEIDYILKNVGDMDEHLNDSNLAIFLKTYEYRGFDADKIRRVVAVKHALFKTGNKLALSEEVDIDIAGKGSMYKLITALVALFNARGNNLETVLDGLTGKPKLTLGHVITTMGLQSKVITTGTKKSSETLTLARIAAAYPIHSLSLIARSEFTRKMISMGEVGLDQKTPIGKCLSHPMAASCLTAPMKKGGMIWITFLASYKLNQVIGGKDKAKPDRLWLFHKAALNSSAVTEEDKVHFWNKHKFEMDQYDTAIKNSKTTLESLLHEELVQEIDDFE
nr:MAG: nucleoprotein [Coquillettidia bunyavirus]